MISVAFLPPQAWDWHCQSTRVAESFVYLLNSKLSIEVVLVYVSLIVERRTITDRAEEIRPSTLSWDTGTMRTITTVPSLIRATYSRTFLKDTPTATTGRLGQPFPSHNDRTTVRILMVGPTLPVSK